MTKPKQPIVLMYHSIGKPVPKEREVGAELYEVSAEQFRTQMHWLKDLDAYPVTVDLPEPDAAPVSPRVILTFDDGEENNFIHARPILEDMGFKAYFFVIVKRVGRDGYMSWDQLREMHEAGMIIGSHGLTHEILTNLKETQIEQELSASKKNIETNLQINVDSLSIPRGFFNQQVKDIARQVGYKKIFISEASASLAEGCWPRLAVKGNWTLQRFQQALLQTVPWTEKVLNQTKKGLKFVLREPGYNFFRSLFLEVFK